MKSKLSHKIRRTEMKRLVIIFFALILTISLTGLNAQTKKDPVRYAGIGAKFIEELDLSETQVDQINNLRYAHQEEMIDLRSRVEKNRLEMLKLIGEDQIDTEKVIELSEQGSAIQAEMKRSKVNMWIDIYKLLDESQKKTWAKGFSRLGFELGFGRHDRRGMRGEFRGRGYDRQGLREMRYRERDQIDN
jgi:Spy/CpxP family protein refolding chaperone